MRHSIDRTRRATGYRAALLGGASALALGLAAPQALAGTVSLDIVTNPASAVANAQLHNDQSQSNTGAAVAGVAGAIVSNGIIVDGGTSTGTGASTNVNLISAYAGANQYDLAVTADMSLDLSLLNPGSPGGGDAASIVAQTNGPGGTIQSSVLGSTISNTVQDVATGSIVNDGNLISAETAINASVQAVSGQIPNPYGNATPGSATVNGSAPGSVIAAGGSVVVATAQQNVLAGAGAGSYAEIGGNQIGTSLTSVIAGDNSTSAALSVADNAVQAIYTGNNATASISADAGKNPALAGSLVVSTTQANLGDSTGGGLTGDVAASNASTGISADVGESGADSYTLNGGAIDLSSNTISSSATGNKAGTASGIAGNSITLAPQLSFVGSDLDGGTSEVRGPSVQSTVAADIVLQSSQINSANGLGGPASFRAETDAGWITSDVDNAVSATVTLDGNLVSASAGGNDGNNAIRAGQGGGTASFTGSAALASAQLNDAGTVVSALNDDGWIYADVTGGPSTATLPQAVDSTVALTNNAITAAARGSQVANTVSITANAIDTGTSQAFLSSTHDAGGTGDLGASALGGVTLNNGQANLGGSISATNDSADIAIYADENSVELTGDTLSITGGGVAIPALQALAVGSSASNTLGLTATTLGGSAGVLNTQHGEASVASLLDEPQITLDAGNDTAGVSDSTLSITGNLLRAISYNNSTGNALNVAGTTTTIPAGVGAASGILYAFDAPTANTGLFDSIADASAHAGYAVLSNQAALAATSADVNVSDDAVIMTVGGVGQGIATSSANVDTNSIVAAAYGNQGSSALSLDANTFAVAGAGYAPAANVTSLQTIGNDVPVSATIDATGNLMFALQVGDAGDQSGDAVTSNLSVSKNVAQVVAYGNQAGTPGTGGTPAAGGNTLTVTGGTITDASTAGLTGLAMTTALPTGTMGADLAFTVQNAQHVGQGSVSADIVSDSIGAQLQVGGNVVNSQLTADSNQFLASATSNAANNAVNATVGTFNSTAGVQSLQVAFDDPSATLGTEGTDPTPGTPPTPYNFTATFTTSDPSGTNVGSTINGDGTIGNPWTYTGWIYTSDSTAAGKPGWSLGTDGNYYYFETGYDNGATYPTPATQFAFSGTFGGTSPTAGTPNSPAVVIDPVDITDSQLSVSTNLFSTSTVANNVSNAVHITATTADGSGGIIAPSGTQDDAGTQTALADLAVNNNQQFLTLQGGAASVSKTFGAAGIESTLSPTASVITGSTLVVKDNTAQGTAQGNIADNELSLAATNSGLVGKAASGALVSYQNADAPVTASSDLQVFAPGAVDTSTVQIDSNKSTSLARVNDVTNAVSFDVANLGSASGLVGTASALNDTGSGITTNLAAADVSLNTNQTSSSIAAASASSTANNYDFTLAASSGLVNSTASIDTNKTIAEVEANLADSTLSVSGTNVSASGALLSTQFHTDAAVTATADASQSFSLTGGLAGAGADPAIDTSTLTLNSNAASATARINQATNDIEVTAANLTPPNSGVQAKTSGSTTVSPLGPTSTADYALLNGQQFDVLLPPSATSTNKTTVSLAGGTAASAVVDSTVDASSNTSSANVYGNTANNTVAFNPGATLDATAALYNAQFGSGDGSAQATETNTATISIDGSVETGITVDPSTLTVTGNVGTAIAQGNTATNSITGAADIISAGPAGPGNPANAVINSAAATNPTANGGYALTNQQENAIGESATGTGTSGVSILAGIGANAVASGNVLVDGNLTQSQAVSNSADSSVTLDAGSTIDSTVALLNSQTATATTALATNTATVNVTGAGTTGATVLDTAVGVTNNSATALARGNDGDNEISVSGDIIQPGVGFAAAMYTGPSPTSSTSSAGYALTSVQVAGTTSATAFGIAEILLGAGTGGSASTSVLSVADNVAASEAETNVVVNTLSIGDAESPGSTTAATGGLTSTQTAGITLAAATNTATLTVSGNTNTAESLLQTSLDVTGNAATALARGNDGGNQIVVSGNLISGLPGPANVVDDAPIPQTGNTSAGYALTSTQAATGPTSATANGIASLNVTGGTGVASSTEGGSLTVSDNAASAEADANVVQNAVVLGSASAPGSTISSSAGVLSTQAASGPVSATANGIAQLSVASGTGGAGAAVASSPLTVDGNSTSATARGNSGANSLTASADIVAGGIPAATASTFTDPADQRANSATADYVVASGQSLTSTVTANSAATYGIGVSSADVLNSVVDTGISLAGNSSAARATGNVASNTASLTATSTLGLSGGGSAAVLNYQHVAAGFGVSAIATTNGTVSVTDSVGQTATVATSSIDVSGNSSVASARGNVATNALNALGGAVYGSLSTSGTSSNGSMGAQVNTAFGVLNDQGNGSAVSSSATGGYTVVLNSGTVATAALSSGSVNNSGNSFGASSVGNSAGNSVELTALNTSIPSAGITNYQVNSGPISAITNGAAIVTTVTGPGTVSGSSFAANGNSISAIAIANSATGAITAH